MAGWGSRLATTKNCLKGRAFSFTFYLDSLQSTIAQMIWRLARNRVLKFLNRFREEGFLTGKTGLRLLRDGTKAPHHLAPSVVQYQR